MAKDYKYIIKISSSTVELTGVFIENENFGRFFHKEYKHDGLNKTFFKNPEKLIAIIEKLLKECSDKVNKSVSNVYVLLSQRFFRFKNDQNSIEIKNGLVNLFDVQELKDKSISDIDDCTKIECIPIAFRVNDDYLDNPIGQECEKMDMIYVAVGILNRVKEFFDDMAKRLDVSFNLIPVTDPILCKLQKDLNTNRSSRLLLYFDEDSIDVCYCEMAAIISSKNLDVGNNDLVNVLRDFNKIDIDIAEELLRHINLNISSETDEKDNYVIGMGKKKIYNIQNNNENVKKVLNYMSTEIKNAIESLVGDAVLPIYITGEDVCTIKGLERYLTERLGMSVKILKPDLLNWDKSSDYSIVGLLENFYE